MDYLSKFKNKNILIIGGLGFIGHNLVRKLSSIDCTITVIDNCFNSNINCLEDIRSKFNFVQESALSENIFEHFPKANYIFHLACIQINHSSKDPELDLNVNALSTLRMLEFIRKNALPQLERFIYTSTTSIYGSPVNLPINESDRPDILNHYAASKLLAENYVILYNLQYQVPTTVIRYSNVYGYGQTPNNPYCGVIGKFIHNAIKGTSISIFGDGEQTRDYTFIEDAIEATLIAATHAKSLGDVFNIATSSETSVNTLALILKEQFPELEIEYVPERDIDNIRRRALSIAKINQKLGWFPKTNIKDGLKKTANWYKTTIIA